MRDLSAAPALQSRTYGPQLRGALEHLEALVVKGLRHGFFDYSIKCEIGKDGRRELIIGAGTSYKFTIPENELPR
jgi:hypothetical protein